MEDNNTGVGERIVRLLMLGRTRRQLIKEGYAERTVDAAIKKFKKQMAGFDEETARSAADFLDSVIISRYMADLQSTIKQLSPQYGISEKWLLRLRHLMAAVGEEMKKKGWKYGV